METTHNWADNKRHMMSLWPRWKPTPEESTLLNNRWGELRQDVLRTCIDNNRLRRSKTPDIAAIHQEYCRVTGAGTKPVTGLPSDVERTRRELSTCVPPSDDELAAWDAWAEEVLATATPAEIDAVRERMPVGETRRVLAIAVDYCRRNPRHR